MQKITLLQEENNEYKYIGKIEWRADTYQQVKNKIVEINIDDDVYDKIHKYWCTPSYIDGVFSVEDSVDYINRYKKLRADAYPSMLEYIDAQVKKSSSDPVIAQQGIIQENQYLSDCLAVKDQYPKPQ